MGQRIWHGEVALLELDGAAVGGFGPEARAWFLQMLRAEPRPRALVLAIRGAPLRGSVLARADGMAPPRRWWRRSFLWSRPSSARQSGRWSSWRWRGMSSWPAPMPALQCRTSCWG
ncbi:MAG: hypothetical protein V4516_12225 [Pseudomonadota bacterium]